MKIQRTPRLHVPLIRMMLLASWLAAPSVFAQVGAPAVINYQGRLYDPSLGGTGGPMTGTQQVQFRIWDSLTGGTLIWGRQFPVSCTTEGVFNVLLNDGGTWLAGATNQLPAAFLGKDRFLELTVVGHGAAISPRQQLVSAPFAMQSAYAVDASSATRGFTVAGGLVVSGGATVNGSAALNNDVEVKGNATLRGTAQVAGNLTVNSPSAFAGYGTIPIGGIILWSGASAEIPDGWTLCDGSTVNGHPTPNLRDRFVVGAGGAYAVGATGGSNQVTLSTGQMPVHGHPYKDAYYIEAYGPDHSPSGGGSTAVGSKITGSDGTDNDNQYFYWRAMTTDNAGNGESHENRPPYYALCYIMRVK